MLFVGAVEGPFARDVSRQICPIVTAHLIIKIFHGNSFDLNYSSHRKCSMIGETVSRK